MMDEYEINPNDLLRNFDYELQRFYFGVISKEKDIKKRWHAIGMRRALKDVIDAYLKKTVRKHMSYIRFDNSSKRCSYVMKHSPLFTSAVAKYFLQVIQKNKYALQKALKKEELAICCLGGGPASDAVAIIRVFRGIYQLYKPDVQDRKTLKVHVTVVDISDDWRETAKNVLECLKETPKFFGRNEIELSYEFHQADLTEKMSDEVKKNIGKADIVSMIYFLSAVNGSKAKDKSLPMMENIMLTMKRNSVLFFLDSAADHHYKLLNVASEKRKTMTEIHGPLVEEFHTLSIDSVEEFLHLYSKYFFRYVCMTNVFVSVSAWYKPEVRHIQLIKRIVNDKPPSWKTPTAEESDKLTLKMKTYRRTVQRLVDKRFSIPKRQLRFHINDKENTADAMVRNSKQDSEQSMSKTKSFYELRNTNYDPLKYVLRTKANSMEFTRQTAIKI